jgi:hypothetical protein
MGVYESILKQELGDEPSSSCEDHQNTVFLIAILWKHYLAAAVGAVFNVNSIILQVILGVPRLQVSTRIVAIIIIIISSTIVTVK